MRQLLILWCCFSVSLYWADTNDGIIASYYFSGNANDSKSQINGKVVGASLTSDRFGNPYAAYSFDGVNDYITLGTNTDLRQRIMSISIWTKVYDFKSRNMNYPCVPFIATRARDAVEYYEAYSIGADKKSNKISAAAASLIQQQVSSMSPVRMEVDKWYHIVYAFDPDSTWLYVNGRLEQVNYKGFISNYLITDSVVLGFVGNHMPDTFKYRNYSWLNGCIDDLKFYNHVLTPLEVEALYNEPDPMEAGSPDSPYSISLLELLRRFWSELLILAVIVFLVIIGIRWRINYIRRKEKEQNDLQQKFAQLEMKALRSQMNPHFIFNAINSIQHYVLTSEKELANKYLVKFSQLMRNILDLSKQELISLKDELETVGLYLDIESLRFNNAFSFSISVSPDVSVSDIRLPPLIIQPFVENAIWHGLLLREGNKKLEITVSREENVLVIKIDDNGIGRQAAQKFSNKELKRRSFGMDITQDRLNVLEQVFGISISFYVQDKTDKDGIPLGTAVFINIKL